MTSRDFCYWLQGFFEITGDNATMISEEQMGIIKRHLDLVFKHEIDPSMGDEKHQSELNQIHNKPTLAQLGEQYGFPVTDSKWGSPPGPGYKLSTLHGWYKESKGIPRC